jgi:CRP-like cAMP-binding protein/predicted MFS family arabinose efflux permease
MGLAPGVGPLTASFGLFSLSYATVTLALAIYGFGEAGALGAGLAGARVIPAAAAGIVGGRVAARAPPGVVLLGVTTGEVLLLGAVGAGVLAGAPFGVVLALAIVDAVVVMAYQPAQARLLPALVRTPSELTAAAATLSNVKGASQVAGALAGGVLIEAAGPAATFLLAALVVAVAGGIMVSVVRRVRGGEVPIGAGAADPQERPRRGIDPGVARVMAVSGIRSFVRGLWTTLATVVALDVMGLGESGVGLLMAAAGLGVLMALPASGLLVGRHSLLAPLAAALALFGAPLLLIAAVPELWFALGLLALWGLGAALADATVSSLLFRIVAGPEIARVVGAVESLKLALGGGGALAAPALVGAFGVRGAIAFTGAVPFALLVVEWRGLRQVDDVAGRRVERLELLGRVPLFRALRVNALEQTAAALVPMEVPAGVEVVRQDDPDARRFFLLEDGIADVLVDGWLVATLGPGSSFGEKALLRSVPRAATVRARTQLRLQALDRAHFLAAATSAPDGGVLEPGQEPLPAPAEPAELLRVVPLLTGLEQSALETMAALGHRHTVRAGDDVVREGEPGDRFYVLLEGTAAVYSGERLIRTLARTDYFGEIALLHQVPRTATVRSVTDVRLLSLDREALLRASPDGLATEQLV